MDAGKMVTEQQNPESMDIDTKSTLEIVRIINEQDKTIAHAVERVLPQIAEAIELVVAALNQGGRLLYVGAGTSGRLGVLDAAECPPTFGTDPDTVQGIIAGGPETVFRAREGSEDREHAGGNDLQERRLSADDVVVGLSTSGRAPYVQGALKTARQIGAKTIAVLCNPTGPIAECADVVINPIVGPEVVTGSTRMKAGTAEKMILNMISTTAMIKLGRVTGNLMTDLQITCNKLRTRATQIVMQTADVDKPAAEAALRQTHGNVKAAIELAKAR